MADEETPEPPKKEEYKKAEGAEGDEGKAEEGAEAPDAARSKIDEANDAAARLERANAKKEKLLDREETMRVKETLGGKAEAGEKKEETPEEYAKRVMANDGTGN